MPTILIQRGHVAPREPGFEAGTGAAGEQEVVSLIAAELASILARDTRFAYRVIPGQIPLDVRSGAYAVDAFVSLHCDGSADKNKRGWGIGYPSGQVNRQLANVVGEEIAKIHPAARIKDNYTTNMSGYYGYSRVPTPGPEILVEHGFVSSPPEKKWMVENAARLAGAEYAALLRFFKLPAKPPKPADSWITPEEAQAAWDPTKPIWLDLPGPKGKPEWLWQDIIELDRRKAVLRSADQ